MRKIERKLIDGFLGLIRENCSSKKIFYLTLKEEKLLPIACFASGFACSRALFVFSCAFRVLVRVVCVSFACCICVFCASVLRVENVKIMRIG